MIVSKINKSKSIPRGHITSKVSFLAVGSILFGVQSGCRTDSMRQLGQLITESTTQDDQVVPLSTEFDAQTVQENLASAGSGSLLGDGVTYHLGVVSCLKKDGHIGFIKVDQKSKATTTKSPVGLLFYSSKDLTNCSAMHLSKEGITWSDRKDSISNVIVVEGDLFELVYNEAELLQDINHNRVQVTHASDVTVPSSLDYGITSVTEFEKIRDDKGVVLHALVDGIQHKNIEKAAFVFAKGSCSLAKLVRSILCESDEETQTKDHKVCTASVLNDLLTFSCPDSDGELDFVDYKSTYCYLKKGNFYTLSRLDNVKRNSCLYASRDEHRVVGDMDASTALEQSKKHLGLNYAFREEQFLVWEVGPSAVPVISKKRFRLDHASRDEVRVAGSSVVGNIGASTAPAIAKQRVSTIGCNGVEVLRRSELQQTNSGITYNHLSSEEQDNPNKVDPESMCGFINFESEDDPNTHIYDDVALVPIFGAINLESEDDPNTHIYDDVVLESIYEEIGECKDDLEAGASGQKDGLNSQRGDRGGIQNEEQNDGYAAWAKYGLSNPTRQTTEL